MEADSPGVTVRALPPSSPRFGQGIGSDTPDPATATADAPVTPGSGAEIAVSRSPAVIALLDEAQRQQRDGQAAHASASLERALRLEPRNPALWHELARVRCHETRYAECESLAVRSNGLGAPPALARANWALIASAREELGDLQGAEEARATAARIVSGD